MTAYEHGPDPNDGEPIDFAIVTALRVEREAVRQRLDIAETIQEEGDPHTYYAGYVAIPGSAERYRVVLLMLLGMGNDEAAASTTRLVQRWRPASVLMVGIAGGVRGEVELGDVVVADFAYYYELAKLTEVGEQLRPQQFFSDRQLYGRALAYEATEWKADISVPRPGSIGAEAPQPQVHFGPIASGDKVIADRNTLPRLLDACPKMLAVAMEGAGVARGASHFSPSPRFLEIRGISDFADAEKNDNWRDYAANSAAAFAVGFLRSRPSQPFASLPSEQVAGTTAPPLLIIRAQSLRPIGPDELLADFPPDLKRRDIETEALDFTSFVQGDRFEHPAMAVEVLTDPNRGLLSVLSRRDQRDLVFHGLVHIPLAVLAGHLVTDRQRVRLFDFHPGEEAPWAWPASEGPFPDLSVRGLPSYANREAGDVVIRVSVSYAVTEDQTRVVVPKTVADIDLSVPEPVRSVVQSEAQVRVYGGAFRRTLDLVAQRLPEAGQVHLFYAGPVSLAFHLGQQISTNIHPSVTVWNYHRPVGYEWGIDLRKAITREPSVARTQGMGED